MSFKTSFKNAAWAFGRRKIGGIEIRDLLFARSLDRNSWSEQAGSNLHVLASGALTAKAFIDYGNLASILTLFVVSAASLTGMYLVSRKMRPKLKTYKTQRITAPEAEEARVELQEQLRSIGIHKEIFFIPRSAVYDSDRGANPLPCEEDKIYIALGEATIKSMTKETIKAVAAHEIGHVVDPFVEAQLIAIGAMGFLSTTLAFSNGAFLTDPVFLYQLLILKSFRHKSEHFADRMAVVFTQDAKTYGEMLKDVHSQIFEELFGTDKPSKLQNLGLFFSSFYPLLSTRLRRLEATERLLKRARLRHDARPG
jgi:Zn-dependent protease with chaperone function